MDPTNITLITQKQKLLSEAIIDTKDKLDSLKETQRLIDEGKVEATAEQYRDLQREIASTEAKLKQLSNEYKEFASVSAVQLRAVGKEFQQIGQKMTDAGKSLLPLTAAIGAIGVASVSASIQFESSFAGVKKTVDATTEELEELAESARQAALVKPVDANSINYIMELGGQLGVASNQLSKFSSVVGDLSVSTNLGIEDASMQLAQFSNIVGTSIEDIDRLGSTLVGLGNNSATTEAAIMEMAMRIAGSGSQIGMTESQILGFSAALSSVGINAEAGGSAISQIMSQIDKDCATGGEALDAWASAAGMSAQQFKAAWETDAASALVSLVGGMQEAVESGSNINLILDSLGITALRQTDTLKRLTSASELMTATIDVANVSWEENVALTNEATQRYQTTESRLIMLKNKVTDVGISIGNGLKTALVALMDVLQPVLNAVQGAARAFENANPAVQTLVISTAGLAASLGPLMIITGKITSGLGSLMVTMGKSAAAFAAKAAATSGDTAALAANSAATNANAIAVNAQIIKNAIKEATDVRLAAKTAAKTVATTADTAATVANTAATGANATAAGAASIKVTALTVASKAKAAAATVATTAQLLWNAAMTANPIGLVIAAVGALVAVIGTLSVAITSNIDKQEKLTASSQKQKDKIDELQATYDEIVEAQGEHSDAAIEAKYALEQETAAFEASKVTIDAFNAQCEEAISAHDDLAASIQQSGQDAEAQAGKILYLSTQITELAAKEEKSAEDKAALAAMTETLNASCEGLNLTYDAQNDALSMNAEAIKQAAQAEADRVRQQAAMQAYSDLVTEQIELEIQLAQAQENLAAETNRNVEAWGMLGDVQVYTSQAQLDLEQSVRDTEAALEENNAAQQMALDISAQYAAGQSALADAVEEVRSGVLSAEEAAEKYSSAVEGGITADEIRAELSREVRGTQEELAQAVSDAAEATESYAGAFSTLQSAMGQSFADAASRVKDSLLGVETALSSAEGAASESGEATGNNYSTSLTAAISACPAEVQAYITQLEGQLSAFQEQAGQIGSSTGSAYGGNAALGMQGQTEAVAASAATLRSSAQGELDQLPGSASTAGSNAGSAFSGGILGAVGSAVSAAGSLRFGAEGQLAGTNAGYYGSNAGNAFGAGIGGAFDTVSANAATIAACCRQWSEFGSLARTWGWDAGSQFASGLQSAKNLVRNAATAIASAARSILHFSVPDEGPLADADEYGPDFGMLIADGLRSKIAEVRTAASDVAQAAKDELTGSLSGNLSIGGGMSLGVEAGSLTAGGRAVFSNALSAMPASLLSLANAPAISPFAMQLAGGSTFASKANEQQQANTYNFGDINISAADVRDVQTVDDFVKVLQRAKAANPTRG